MLVKLSFVVLLAPPVQAFTPQGVGSLFIRPLQYARDGAVLEPADIAVAEAAKPKLPPGLKENEKFACDESVQFWRNFQSDGFLSDSQNAQALADVSSRFMAKGPAGISYWVRHVGRSGYFATNAVLGILGFQLQERSSSNQNKVDEDKSKAESSRFDLKLRDRGFRLLVEAALCYEQDYEQIQMGVYREPWDMNPTHRQFSPQNVLAQTNRLVRDVIGTLTRVSRAEPKDKQVDFSLAGLKDENYPKYYETAFHYQNNGWMSKDSADVYEVSTETLFLGRQDAMQRTSLPALMERAKRVRDRPMKVLEVACGTGRFMTFARDNLPLDTEYTAVDLSPFYLDAARDNDAYWIRTRKSQENAKRTSIRPARVMQAPAERLPFADDAFDAVVCIYLFHELPQAVRARAAAEMARVVRPGGGTVILTDSIQRGDRPALDETMGSFGNMNEPYYLNYIQDDLSEHFERAGLHCKTKSVRSSTKSLSFGKK